MKLYCSPSEMKSKRKARWGHASSCERAHTCIGMLNSAKSIVKFASYSVSSRGKNISHCINTHYNNFNRTTSLFN